MFICTINLARTLLYNNASLCFIIILHDKSCACYAKIISTSCTRLIMSEMRDRIR